MAWNPYTDQKNRGYQSILRSLFPEQTKTLPRILAWGIIFLIDLIAGVILAFQYGFLNFTSRLVGPLLFLAIVGIFWLQGKIWYAVVDRFKRRNELG